MTYDFVIYILKLELEITYELGLHDLYFKIRTL
jgi:hypothetical protein